MVQRGYREDRLQAAAFDTWFCTSMLAKKITANRLFGTRHSLTCIGKNDVSLGIRVGFRMVVVNAAYLVSLSASRISPWRS